MDSVLSVAKPRNRAATMASILQNFANALNERLDEMGWKPAKLAKNGGWSRSTVSDWLNAKRLPRPEEWDALCQLTKLEKPYEPRVSKDKPLTTEDALRKLAAEHGFFIEKSGR